MVISGFSPAGSGTGFILELSTNLAILQGNMQIGWAVWGFLGKAT
jgi:hypothetical protein